MSPGSKVSIPVRRRRSSPAPLVEARIRVRFPRGFPLAQFVEGHPDAEFLFVNRYPVPPHQIVAEVQIRSRVERDWVAELRKVEGVESVQSLEASGRPGMYRYRWKPPAYFPILLEKYDLIGSVPMTATNGYLTLSIAMSKPRVTKFIRAAQARGFEATILELRPFRGPGGFGGLTPKQRARFQAAVESGYFDVPRRTTLDELARQFAVRKSAFAESLALARRKVLVAAGQALLSEQGGMLRDLLASR